MDKEAKKEIVGMFEYISEKMATKEDFGNLETRMETGFREIRGEMETGFREIRGEMETGFREIRGEMESGFREVRDDIKGLRTDLSLVEEKTENNTGFSEEIDTLFDEVKKIKKHVGLKESF